ncbi:MAG: tyrosine--tRNA ligase [Bacilli bacterium]|nr:tyrosine--tRNA ligase [Bacilli bacterium]
MKLYEELQWRGFIKDVSNEELAMKLLNDQKITFYCGFDPTGESLTIGHLVQIIRIKLLQNYGHTPIVLVGGATGLIGDPSGKQNERKLLTLEQSLNNAKAIKNQLSKYISFDGANGAIMVNNYDWISKISIIEFLRDYGKYFNINYMLAKDSVASRLENGISYTEFSYMIIQAIDFLHLYKNNNCKIQFGGSDQWGNITAGLDLIRKVEGEEKQDVVGLSSYLLTKADGSKFGKSEQGALLLDNKETSPYEIYQYFLNSNDLDVIKYLKSLTLLTPSIINELEIKVKTNPELREAQKVLGQEIVTFLHGKEAYEQALKITEALFSGDIKSLTGLEIEQSFKDFNAYEITENANIVELLTNATIASSKREAREFLTNGSIMINGDKVTDLEYIINKEYAIDSKYIVIRKGKKNYYLVKFI